MKHLKTIMSVLVLLTAVSCVKQQTEGNGLVNFDLKSNLQIADMTRSNVSDYTTLPSSGNFTISIYDAAKALVWSGKVSEWDATTPLIAGNYSVEASYGSAEEEGFDKPYFFGSQTFAVQGGQTATVSIPVSLYNTIVRISCGDYFKKYFQDYSFKITRDGATIATFSKDETRGAFVDGYKIRIEGSMTRSGETKTFSADYTNLKEATAYTFVIDVDNVGGATLTVSFNNTVETINLGDQELND